MMSFQHALQKSSSFTSFCSKVSALSSIVPPHKTQFCEFMSIIFSVAMALVRFQSSFAGGTLKLYGFRLAPADDRLCVNRQRLLYAGRLHCTQPDTIDSVPIYRGCLYVAQLSRYANVLVGKLWPFSETSSLYVQNKRSCGKKRHDGNASRGIASYIHHSILQPCTSRK